MSSKYRLHYTDGQVSEIWAKTYEIDESGTLTLYNYFGSKIASIAIGHWAKIVELDNEE